MLMPADLVCLEIACVVLQPLYVLVIVAFMGYIALAIFFMFRAFHQLKRKTCALTMQHRMHTWCHVQCDWGNLVLGGISVAAQ